MSTRFPSKICSLIVNVHLQLCDTDNCTNHNDEDNAVKGTTTAFYVGVKTSPETSSLWLSLSSKDWQPGSVATQYFVNFSFSALIINSLNAHFGLFSTWSKWLEYNAFTLLLISHPLVAEPAWLQDSWGTKWKSWSYWYLLFWPAPQRQNSFFFFINFINFLDMYLVHSA